MTISKVRRFVPVALVVVGVAMLVGAFAAWRLAPSKSTDRLPDLGPGTSGMVGWSLAAGGGPGSPPKVAPDATVLLVRTNWWPACSPWDANDSWLTQEISYLPWSVTITLHASDSFAPVKCHGFYDYWGEPLEVHLREPLGGRPLFDGGASPPAPRPYP